MKSLRKIKCITLIIAIIFPMIVFSSFFTNVKGETYIDVDNFNDNLWHWGVDKGDTIMFEIEFSISNQTSGKLLQQFKDLMIYNISSIENVTKIISIIVFKSSEATIVGRVIFNPVI